MHRGWRRSGRAWAALLLAIPAGVIVTTGAPAGSSAFPGENGLIVFNRNVGGNSEIFVMEPDGTNVRRLTNNPASDFEPSWSADGTEIVFASDRTGNGDIYVMNADGSDQRRLTTNDATQRGPSFSPDGEHIAYTSNEEADSFDDVFVMDDDGGHQRNISNVTAPAFAIEPTWSPDGEHIAFSLFTASDFEIFVMRPDGSGQTNLTNENALDSDATWSPDGERIAFGRFDAGAAEIWSMNEDGSDKRNLTNNPAADARPAWSPDGERIAFVSDRVGGPGIFVMHADGSDVTRVGTDPSDDDPNWQPVALEGDVTVTKWVNGTPPMGATYEVQIACDDGDDTHTKTLTFGETGGTQSVEREGFGELECEVNETNAGGATTVEITCANAENAECGDDGRSFTLFDDPGGDDTRVEINVTNTFAVTVEPTFTG